MFLEKFDIIITLFAAFVTSVVNYILDVPLFEFATRLIIVIIVFYIIGFFAKLYINTRIFPKDRTDNIDNKEGGMKDVDSDVTQNKENTQYVNSGDEGLPEYDE